MRSKIECYLHFPFRSISPKPPLWAAFFRGNGFYACPGFCLLDYQVEGVALRH